MYAKDRRSKRKLKFALMNNKQGKVLLKIISRNDNNSYGKFFVFSTSCQMK